MPKFLCTQTVKLVDGVLKTVTVCKIVDGGFVGTDDFPELMPVPELHQLLAAIQGDAVRYEKQGRELAGACRERAAELRGLTKELAHKGFEAEGAGKLKGTFQVGAYAVTFGRATSKPQAISTPTQARAVAAVFAQQVVELETLAAGLEGAAWMAETLGRRHRD